MINKNSGNFLRTLQSLCNRKLRYIFVVLVLVSVCIYMKFYSFYTIRKFDFSEQQNIYIGDDEPFRQYVNENYDESELVEWEPAPLVEKNENQAGYLGLNCIRLTIIKLKLNLNLNFLLIKLMLAVFRSTCYNT